MTHHHATAKSRPATKSRSAAKTTSPKAPVQLPSPSPQALTSQTHSSQRRIPQHVLHKSIKTHFPQPSSAVLFESPRSLAHLQRAIHTARLQNRRLKPTNNPASHASLAAYQEGALIVNTSYLNAVAVTSTTVTAQCGARLPNLPLPIVPPDKSVGGALADGALSLDGFAHGLVADCLLAIALLDSNGRLRMYRRDDPTGIFQTLLVSHGLCGIIYEATFIASFVHRVVRVSVRTQPIRVISRNGLRAIVNGRTALEVTWLPFNSCDGVHWNPHHDTVILKAVESTTRQLSPGAPIRYSTISQYILKNCSALAAAGYAAFEGWHTRLILSGGYIAIDKDYVTTLRDAVAEEFDRHAVHQESACFSLNLDDSKDWDRVVKAWQFVLDLVRDFDARDRYPLNMFMKLRFVGGTEALMAVNPGTSCVLTIASAYGTPDWKEFSQQVINQWQTMGARWIVNRCGVGVIDDKIAFVKRVARNAGLDDYGMFEDSVVGIGDIRVLESLESISDVTGSDVVVVEQRQRGELWWAWIYIIAYLLLWCWFFGEEALIAMTTR